MHHPVLPGAGVLSVYPTTRGFAFVLFEEALAPFDWGIKDIRKRDKNEHTLVLVKDLIDRYRPEALVIEDHTERGGRRSERIRKLYRALTHLAESEYVEIFHYPKVTVKQCFEPVGASTRRDISSAIARHIPAFINKLPRRRKAWVAADRNQSLFDAAALGITHYMVRGKPAWPAAD